MSLLILTDRKTGCVGIVEWFKDPTYSIAYPCGPLMEMKMAEFREKGHGLIQAHFEKYDRIRMRQSDAKPVFANADERAYLKGKAPVMISRNTGTGEIHISPCYWRKYALGGLRVYEKERCPVLPASFSEEDFWKAFDEA